MPIRTLIIVALAACAVSGCGRRGSLEGPETPESTLAPEEPAAPAFGSLLPAAEAPEAPPPPVQERPFFLDFLL
jgi:hypothetical protein